MGLVFQVSVTDDGVDALPNQEAPLCNRGTRPPICIASASGSSLQQALDRLLDNNHLARNNLVRRLEGRQEIHDNVRAVREESFDGESP